MNSYRCLICGSTTGEHGFSFSAKAKEAQRIVQEEKEKRATDRNISDRH